MKRLGLIIFLLMAVKVTFADVKLPRLISDGMVLQRNVPLKIWGWASAGEQVTLRFKNKAYKVTTSDNGVWNINLKPLKAGGPYEMDIKGNNQIIIKDILVGDVWVASGQSNMELPMRRVEVLYPDVVKNANNPKIRQFGVQTSFAFTEEKDDFSSGQWKAVTPENILDFTAVGYFFAQSLYEKYQIPIGLIRVSVGGSPAEAWLSEEALHAYPHYLKLTQKYKNTSLVDSIRNKDNNIVDTWNNNIDKNDEGLKNKWFETEHDDTHWTNFSIPGFWDKQTFTKLAQDKNQNLNGAVWLRRDIYVTDEMLKSSALLVLGAIVDRDVVYVNGKQVGTTGYQYPPRRYPIPQGILKPGKNSIAIRVVSNIGKGGFVLDKEYALILGSNKIDLKGDWKIALGYASEPMPMGQTTFHYQPAGLFNAMIAPMLNFPIKGVIWYQGESNTGKYQEYKQLFADLIQTWRVRWKQADMPFLYVQLANFMKAQDTFKESNWAELRNSQLQTLALNHTGMAVTIDVGEWNDIHPLNKKTVGERLALAARKLAYHEKNIAYSGPIYKSMQVKNDEILLSFDHVNGGLLAKGAKLNEFYLAGADKVFLKAEAVISGKQIVVKHPKIKNPVAVRYAWADNPEGANLYNQAGLPASPFATDK
ncbi:glycosyl hydrolases family 2, sugar binding domain [Pedobacter glucosidilyticus]|nr:sialate O-acetylesterase [Pedobacter glucosidilyticus]KHJ37354.1 glycosyl hydrolases family 2, sugar binding domain [Pedobacter glucosidilyticus]